MIYPPSTGKADGKEIRLRTLESVWIQGKLKMWGRWSYIGGGSGGNMFNQLLTSKIITKTAINEVLRRMKKEGVTKSELTAFFKEMMSGKPKSHLALCTDSEAMLIDRVVGAVLAGYPGLKDILHQRYDGWGKSKRKMAEELNEAHSKLSLMTCRRRIDVQLTLAETMPYVPMSDAFERDPGRYTR